MKRREFLLSLTAGGTLIAQVSAADGRKRPYQVLFLTDFHARKDRGVPQALAQVADRVNHLNPDLVIGGGDCIHGGFSGPQETSRERFAVFRDFTKLIKPPAHWLIGNHDFARAVDDEGNILPSDPTTMFKEIMETDELFYSFDAGDVRYFLVQSVEVVGGKQNYRGFIDAKQLAWLKDELEDLAPDQPLVIVTHIPLRTTFMQERAKPTAALTPNLVVENANELLALFQGRNLLAVLQGHLHTNERIIWNDTQFIMGGAVSGAWWKGPNRGTDEGFGQLDFTQPNDFNYQYVDYGWNADVEKS